MTRYRNSSRTLIALVVVLAALAAWPARAAEIRVSVDRSPGSTRLLLTQSEPVSFTIQSSRNRITVRFTTPVVLEPAEMRFEEDRILERYRMRDDYTLQLDVGREFDRYEHFELRNPNRLVLDLKGSQKRRGARRTRSTPLAEPKTIIVIDPGHGGVEHGAVGPTGLREKDVSLQLALQLRQMLHLRDPGISVVLTRDEDRLVGLDERTAVANHNKAALFLSIHLNAAPRRNAAGAETYYLSTDATDDEARNLAALENRSGRSTPSPKKDKLDLVLWDLAQNQYMAESAALAEAIQRQLNQLAGTRNRGVRQAPFRVLEGAMMPAILVEVGFISNPAEESRFKTTTYRTRVVGAITAAVQEFLLNLERFSSPTPRVERPMDLP